MLVRSAFETVQDVTETTFDVIQAGLGAVAAYGAVRALSEVYGASTSFFASEPGMEVVEHIGNAGTHALAVAGAPVVVIGLAIA